MIKCTSVLGSAEPTNSRSLPCLGLLPHRCCATLVGLASQCPTAHWRRGARAKCACWSVRGGASRAAGARHRPRCVGQRNRGIQTPCCLPFMAPPTHMPPPQVYLEDDTMQVTEPAEPNSGLQQVRVGRSAYRSRRASQGRLAPQQRAGPPPWRRSFFHLLCLNAQYTHGLPAGHAGATPQAAQGGRRRAGRGRPRRGRQRQGVRAVRPAGTGAGKFW